MLRIWLVKSRNMNEEVKLMCKCRNRKCNFSTLDAVTPRNPGFGQVCRRNALSGAELKVVGGRCSS